MYGQQLDKNSAFQQSLLAISRWHYCNKLFLFFSSHIKIQMRAEVSWSKEDVTKEPGGGATPGTRVWMMGGSQSVRSSDNLLSGDIMGTSGLWLDILIIFLYQLHKCWQRTEKECNTLEYYCSIVVTLPPLYEYEYKHKTCSSSPSHQSSRGTLDIITIGHRGNLKTLSLNMTNSR